MRSVQIALSAAHSLGVTPNPEHLVHPSFGVAAMADEGPTDLDVVGQTKPVVCGRWIVGCVVRRCHWTSQVD